MHHSDTFASYLPYFQLHTRFTCIYVWAPRYDAIMYTDSSTISSLYYSSSDTHHLLLPMLHIIIFTLLTYPPNLILVFRCYHTVLLFSRRNTCPPNANFSAASCTTGMPLLPPRRANHSAAPRRHARSSFIFPIRPSLAPSSPARWIWFREGRVTRVCDIRVARLHCGLIPFGLPSLVQRFADSTGIVTPSEEKTAIAMGCWCNQPLRSAVGRRTKAQTTRRGRLSRPARSRRCGSFYCRSGSSSWWPSPSANVTVRDSISEHNKVGPPWGNRSKDFNASRSAQCTSAHQTFDDVRSASSISGRPSGSRAAVGPPCQLSAACIPGSEKRNQVLHPRARLNGPRAATRPQTRPARDGPPRRSYWLGHQYQYRRGCRRATAAVARRSRLAGVAASTELRPA